MKPFRVDALPPEAFDVGHMQRVLGLTAEAAENMMQMNLTTIIYTNGDEAGDYQVNVRKTVLAPWAAGFEWPAMLHLSIKRRDKGPIHDWRVMQEIKNQILSPEYEAVELYPAESRLTDTANQYHLWAFAHPGVAFPFGYFDGRNVNDNDGKTKRLRATQRSRT